MQKGKLSEAVLKRSVLRRLHSGIPVQCREYYGMDCAFLPAQDTPAYTSVGLPPGFEDAPGLLAAAAANNLYAGGAHPAGLMVHALLPPHYEEAALQADMEALQKGAGEQGMEIAGGHTQVTDAVTEAVYTAVGIGYRAAARRLPQPGDQLLLTKWIALGGTAALARRFEEPLKRRFPFFLVDQARTWETMISVAAETEIVNRMGPAAVHDLSQGGIFGALWELAERAGVGLEITLKKIPIRQETVEICEYFDVNPYELYSGGSLLISTDQGDVLADQLKKASVPAAVIGYVTKDAGRIIRSGDDVRYLDRPRQDAWYRMKCGAARRQAE